MAFSKIILDFTRRVELGESISFKWRDLDINGGLNPVQTGEVCVNVRQAAGEFIFTNDADSIVSLLNYKSAFDLDFNSTNKFDLTNGANVMEITAKKNNIEFFDFVTNAGVNVTFSNEPQIPTFLLDTIFFGNASSNQCTNINVIVDTLSDIEDVISPLSIVGHNSSHLEFEWTRESTFLLQLNDSNGSIIKTAVNTPKYLLEPTVDIINTPSGATVTASQQTNLPGITYSLDNVTFQNSSVFPGILPGNYDVYAKDTYGCTKSTSFVVDEFTIDISIDEPVAFVSNTNSLRFKLNEVWDNVTIYKNDNNTLSSEEKGTLIYPYIHKYQNTDIVETQVKTNYDTVIAEVSDCDGNLTPLTVLKKTANIGKKDRRDALGYEFTDGSDRFGYYFQTGNIYDYDDGALDTITGTYELFGEVPAWAVIGQYFSLNDGAYYQIIDIVEVESIQARVLVISSSFVGDPVNVKLSAIYNVFNWDAHEFDLNMGLFADSEFQVIITFTDAVFDTKIYTSEKIQTCPLWDELITIQASNSQNNEIVYQDGFKQLLRLQFDEFADDSETELETEKTDQYVYSLDGKSYIKKKITFNYLSTKMQQKLRQILTLDDIKIDGVGHTVDAVEAPERLGVTNFYKLTATLFEVGEKPQGTLVDTNVDLDVLDVPALVLGNDEFIKQ